MSKGTYAALRVLDPANSLLYNHCNQAGISVKKSLFDRRLHTTVIYSRVYCPEMIKAADPTTIHECWFTGYDVFDTSVPNQKALVVKLNAPSVVARHLKLMADHGASYDHPTFQPHITLTYNYCGTDTSNLRPITFPIFLGEEYIEDLNLGWGK